MSTPEGTMAPAEPTARPLLTSVARAADVLLLFGHDDRRDLGVTDVATALGLSKAVVHRTLTTLVAKGLLEVDATSRRYRVGPAVLALGLRYADALDVRQLAAPSLRSLSDLTGETATLSIRSGDERVYVDQVRPDREVQMSVTIGRGYPLHAGASSKAFLAFLPEPERRAELERALEPLTAQTVTTPTELEAELEAIRHRGYARSVEERQSGAASVAAPVLDHRGSPVAVLSVCGPMERLTPRVDQIADHLLAETHRLSNRLGYRGNPSLSAPEDASIAAG
jgi:IclR family transcriptional regulator, acetate operon repressor